MIDWNKRNGGFLDDFNVMNYQVSNLSQQIDKLQQELQRKDNIINEVKELLKNPYNQDCINQNNDFLDKIKKLEESK